jgi:hypothetical protein
MVESTMSLSTLPTHEHGVKISADGTKVFADGISI